MGLLKKILSCLSIAAVAALIISGCTAASDGSYSITGNADKDQIDNELNVMEASEVQSLDPQLCIDGISMEILSCTTEGLMIQSENCAAAPGMAESYEISDDGLCYTFHLRDAKWSNGTPVTANDFVYGWRRAVDPANASEYAYMLSDIGQVKNAAEIIDGKLPTNKLGVTAIDDKTLQVQLTTPVSFFLELMYFSAYYPMNQAFYESCNGNYGSSPETTLSNGAFVLDSYEPAAITIHMHKNESYYDSDRISLSGIQFQVIKDSQQAIMSYMDGDMDIVELNGEEIELVKDDPARISTNNGSLFYLSYNMKNNPELANRNLKLSITYAINRQAITDHILEDGSVPLYSVVPPDVTFGPDGSDFCQGQSRYSDVCCYDIEKAKAHFEKAKAELGKDTFSFDITLYEDSSIQEIAQYLKEQLEKNLSGLKINLVIKPKKQCLADEYSGNYEIMFNKWGGDYSDPTTYLSLWKTGSKYCGGWSNTEYDAILDRCSIGALSSDSTARWKALQDAEEILMNDAVIAPLYSKYDTQMISPKVSGIEFYPVGINRLLIYAKKE